MPRGDHVNYVVQSGDDPIIVHVLADKGDTKLDLQLPNGGIEPSIPRRDPEDYDEKGGGKTWHPVS